MLRLNTLGRVLLSGPGSPDLSQQRRRLAFLALLADSGARGMTRDQLLAQLWSERPADAGRHALDQMLYMLRRSLGADLLLGVDPLRLNPDAIGSDLADFESAVAADDLQAAVASYGGPFLDGFFLNDAPEFDRWVEAARARHAARYRDCLERLARDASAAHDREGSARWWRRRAAEEPLSSRVALELMRALVASGDRAAAVSHGRVHQALVRQELDVEPDPSVASYVADLCVDGTASAPAPAGDSASRLSNGVMSNDSAPAVVARDASVTQAGVQLGSTAGTGPPARHRPFRRFRSVAMGVAFALGGYVAIQAFTTSWGQGLRFTRGDRDGRIVLLVADLSVAGIDTMTGKAISLALRTALSESPVVAFYPSDSVMDALQRMRQSPNARMSLPLAREVARREGARIQAIVDGHVVAMGSGYDVGLTLVSPQSGDELFRAHRFAPELDSILPAFDGLARALRSRIGESVGSIRASQPLPRVTTASLGALRLFAAAMAAGYSETAVTLLREAVAVDTQFAMAYRRLFVVNGTLGHGDPDSAMWKAYRHRTHLTERERLAVDAMFYSLPGHGGDRPRAINANERLLALGDSTYLVNLAGIHRFRREYAKSESLAVLAAKVCRCPYPWDDVLRVQVDAGKLDAAEQTLRDVRVRFHGHPLFEQKWPQYMKFHRGDLEAYERGADSIRALPDPGARRAWTKVKRDIALTRGRLTEAERLRDELAVLEGEPQGRRRNDWLEQMQINLVVRRDTARAVRLLEEHPVLTPGWRGDPRRLLDIVPQLARTGQPERARQLLARYERTADTAMRRKSIHDYHVARAHIAFAERRFGDAIAEFRLGDLLPDGPRNPMWYQLSGRLGRVYDAAGQVDSAVASYERWVDAPGSFRPENPDFELAAVLERLGELHDRRGDRSRAARYYSRFVELWKEADPDLQPRVRAARVALAATSR